MELSKDFDVIIRDLLLIKLHAYDFSIRALNLVCNYFNKKKKKKGLRRLRLRPTNSLRENQNDKTT